MFDVRSLKPVVSLLAASMIPLGCLLAVTGLAKLADAEPIEIATVKHDGPVDFQQEILPVLRKKCLACHNQTDAESDLVLENPATIIKGGSQGPAVVPGKSDDSLVLQSASHRVEPIMPPEDNDAGAEPLTPEELGLLKLWIDQGAKGDINVVDVIDWQPLPPGVNPVYAVASSPHGDLVAVGRANQIDLYRPGSKQRVAQLTDPELGTAHLDIVQALAFHPDGRWIASGGYRTVKLWRRSPELIKQAKYGETRATAAELTHDRSRLVIGDEQGQLSVWDLQSDQLISAWSGHTGQITQIALNPEQGTIASIGEDQTLRIWSNDGSRLFELSLDAKVADLSWVGRDKLAMAAGDLVRIWTWSQGDSPQLDEAGQLTGTTSAMVPVGTQQLLAAGQDGVIRLWNLDSGEQVKQLAHGSAVTRLVATPDGKRCLSSGPEGTKLWDLETGKPVAELKGSRHLQKSLERRRLHFEVAQLHVANAKKDLEEGEKRKKQEDDNLKKVEESRKKADEEFTKKNEAADQASAAEKSAQDEVDKGRQQLDEAMKQLADAQEKEAKQQGTEAVNAAKKAIEAADKKLAEAKKAAKKASDEKTAAQRALESADRSLQRAKQAVAQAESAIPPLKEAVTKREEQLKSDEAEFKATEKENAEFKLSALRAAVSPDGASIAIAASGRVTVWSTEDGQWLGQLQYGDEPLMVVGFDNEGQLRTLDAAGGCRKWRIGDEWELAKVIGRPDAKSQFVDRITALGFSPDGQLLAVGGGEPSRSGEVKIFSVEDAQLVRQIDDAHSDTVFGIAFSPDGNYLATCGADRFIKVFDAKTGELVRTFEGHTHHVLAVAWQADGRVLVSAGADKVVKIWDFKNAAQIRTIQGFGKEVTSLQFAGSSNRFYAACGDKSLYRCDTGGKRDRIGSSGDFLYAVSSNMTGDSVAFAGEDSVLRIVNADGKELIELAPDTKQ